MNNNYDLGKDFNDWVTKGDGERTKEQITILKTYGIALLVIGDQIMDYYDMFTDLMVNQIAFERMKNESDKEEENN